MRVEPELYVVVQTYYMNNPRRGLGVRRWGRLRLGPDFEVKKYTSKLAIGTLQGV